MKLLIVDDEKHVRDAIQLLLPWEQLGFDQLLSAERVEEAIDLIAVKKPELAIVDVVIENVYGMDIMNYINDHSLRTKVIVISGHDDFQYVRAMFVLGAVEYLLKPIEPDKLSEAVKKALEFIQLEKRDDRDTVKEEFAVDKRFRSLSPDYQHSLLRKLFQPELKENAYKKLIRMMPSFLDIQNCVILHLDGNIIPVHQNGYILKFSRFLNAVQEYLEADNSGTIFQNMLPYIDVVILLYGDNKCDFEELLREIRHKALQENCLFSFGKSGIHPFPAMLEKAWNEARLAFLYTELPGAYKVREYDEALRQPRLKTGMACENALTSAVFSCNISSVERALSEWIRAITEGLPHTVGVLELLWKQFFSFYEKYQDSADIIGEETDINMNDTALGDLLRPSWHITLGLIQSYFIHKLSALIRQMRDIRSAEGKMQQVENYLETNYMDDISQQECADLFHINKDYLSRAFKKYTGIGMARYLNNIRIRKAKELLTSTELQIQEISDRVGYMDVKYFSRQFKADTGQTPAQYRLEKRQ